MTSRMIWNPSMMYSVTVITFKPGKNIDFDGNTSLTLFIFKIWSRCMKRMRGKTWELYRISRANIIIIITRVTGPGFVHV